jgi:antitoxin component HigA of HigAB toxin-antitoxin module
LIEQYEKGHYSFDLPDPIEAIKFRMDQMNLDQQDLMNKIGSKSRAKEKPQKTSFNLPDPNIAESAQHPGRCSS